MANQPKKGDVVGNYVLEEPLGQGGMGLVFRSRHRELNRQAAIKFLVIQGLERIPREVAARFMNEAKLANVVPHPSIVQVYEAGELPDGQCFMIMELITGVTVSQRLRDARLTPNKRLGLDGLHIIRQIASGLAEAHRCGVVHRDLKPSNVMLVPDPEARDGERVKILDFGIAKLVRQTEGVPVDHLLEVRTATNANPGTPAYMSPEMWKQHKTLDDRADVYALGVMSYQILGDAFPFTPPEQGKEGEWLGIHLYDDPLPLRPRAPELPEELLSLVDRMLAKVPAERPSMAEVRDTIARLQGLKPGSTLSVPVLTGPGSGSGQTGVTSPTATGAPTKTASPEGTHSGTDHESGAAAPPVDFHSIGGSVKTGGASALPVVAPSTERSAGETPPLVGSPSSTPLGWGSRRSPMWLAIGAVTVLALGAVTIRTMTKGTPSRMEGQPSSIQAEAAPPSSRDSLAASAAAPAAAPDGGAASPAAVGLRSQATPLAAKTHSKSSGDRKRAKKKKDSMVVSDE